MVTPILILAAAVLIPEATLTKAFNGRDGALVLIDCKSGKTERHNPALCARTLPPCSTFKIWNTAIGLETGILTGADQPFFKWDGEKRFIEDWNQDLTLRQAYAFSCVPAYQALARQIGHARMDGWIHKLGYGNEDTASGNDVFWLPAPDRKPILISPDEQADLIRRLVNGDLPFSKKYPNDPPGHHDRQNDGSRHPLRQNRNRRSRQRHSRRRLVRWICGHGKINRRLRVCLERQRRHRQERPRPGGKTPPVVALYERRISLHIFATVADRRYISKTCGSP